jgi:hypothetical protein
MSNGAARQPPRFASPDAQPEGMGFVSSKDGLADAFEAKSPVRWARRRRVSTRVWAIALSKRSSGQVRSGGSGRALAISR